jgi:ferritin-like metal-binding protein YciE
LPGPRLKASSSMNDSTVCLSIIQVAALPKMAKAAQNEDLTAAFQKHRDETAVQVERLEQVFELIEKKPQGKTCDAILGILKEGEEIMDEYKGSPALDAGLVSAAQAVEHYEICRYGTLCTWAEELGLDEAKELLPLRSTRKRKQTSPCPSSPKRSSTRKRRRKPPSRS